jgi:hypothetical protein
MNPIQSFSKLAGKVPAAGPVALLSMGAEAVSLVKSILDHQAECQRIQAQRKQNELQAQIAMAQIERAFIIRMSELQEKVTQINRLQRTGVVQLNDLGSRRDEFLRASLILLDRAMDRSLPSVERDMAMTLSRHLKEWHLALGEEQFNVFDRMATNTERFISTREENAQ